jgi:hypothetical protein
MISIRQRLFETSEKAEKVFSRLTWTVETVDSLHGQRVHSTDTNRQWVGILNSDSKTFELRTLDSRLFNGFLPVSISGQISDNGQKGEITIDFKLGQSVILFIIIFIYAIWDTFNSNNGLNPFLAIWIIYFPTFWTLMIIRKMNKMEKNLKDLFGV